MYLVFLTLSIWGTSVQIYKYIHGNTSFFFSFFLINHQAGLLKLIMLFDVIIGNQMAILYDPTHEIHIFLPCFSLSLIFFVCLRSRE